MEAGRPVLKACVPLQSDPERLDCVPDRATREIVGRRRTRGLCCLLGARSPGTCVEFGDLCEIVGWRCWRSNQVSSDVFCCRKLSVVRFVLYDVIGPHLLRGLTFC